MNQKLIKKIFTPLNITIFLLILGGFVYRTYPHLLVANWLPCEEEYNFMTVQDLLNGGNRRVDFYPMFEHYTVVFFSKVSTIDASVVAKYINPFFGAITIIPVFLLCRKYLDTKYSLFASTLFTFSEAVFYRTSYFGTTETMSLFLSTFALYFFIDKRYVLLAISLVLSFYTHLLPAVFAVAVIIIYKILYGTKKQKLFFSTGIAATLLFLLSPLNPHQRIVSLISPVAVLSKFDLTNIFIYSPTDLLNGLKIFFGLVILVSLSTYNIIYSKKREPIFITILISATLIFTLSWITYSPFLVAPPRLTLYFILPLSFFAAKAVKKINSLTFHSIDSILIFFIVLIMITSAFVNTQTMFWVDNALTDKEYEAINYLKENNLIAYPIHWFCDYGVRVALTANSNISLYETVILNETVSLDYSTEIGKVINKTEKNQTDNEPKNKTTSIFQHIFLSKRMKKEALFLEYTENRTIHIRKPITDIWKDSDAWKVIYTNEEVIIYERE